MQERFSTPAIAPGAYHAMLGLEKYVKSTGLEPQLLHLIKIRASLINGCAFCLDMHTKEARALGETEQRLYLLGAWRESPQFTARERAALAWTDAVTQIDRAGVPDDVYDEARSQFTEVELANLTIAIVAINGWNRISIASRSPVPGSYAVHNG